MPAKTRIAPKMKKFQVIGIVPEPVGVVADKDAVPRVRHIIREIGPDEAIARFKGAHPTAELVTAMPYAAPC